MANITSSKSESAASARPSPAASSTRSTPRPPSQTSARARGQDSSASTLEQGVGRMREESLQGGGRQSGPTLQRPRHYSVPSMVSMDPALNTTDAFGLTFDGTAHYGIPPFPTADLPLPPPPPPYTSERTNESIATSFAPMLVFAPLAFPYVQPQPFQTFGAPFSPSMGQFGYQPSSQAPPIHHYQSQSSRSHHYDAQKPAQQESQSTSANPAIPHPSQTPIERSHSHSHSPRGCSTTGSSAPSTTAGTSDTITTPSTVAASAQGGPPAFKNAAERPAPSAPRDQPKPCDVWTCFRPVFCQLAPCGCRICREHLGTVIRGAKVVEPEQTEEQAERKGKQKVFACVACQARSQTAGPAQVEAPTRGSSKEDDEGNSVKGRLEEFSIHYLHSQPRAYAIPSDPYPVVSASPDLTPSMTMTELPAADVGPRQSSSYQQVDSPPQQLQSVDPSSQSLGQSHFGPALSPHSSFQPLFYSPSTYFDPSPLRRELPPHQNLFFQQHPAFGQPPQPHFDPTQQGFLPSPPTNFDFGERSDQLPPAPRTHPDRRARSFTAPAQPSFSPRPQASSPRAATGANATQVGLGDGGARWTSGAGGRLSSRRVQHRSADFNATGAAVSQRWTDPRGPKGEPSEPYQLQKPLYPVIKVENIPFSTSVADLEKWLPARCLPPDTVVTSIHLILHRATGRTLPHCYLEMASLQIANDLILAMDRHQLGDRTVRLKHERRGELMRDLFSQEGYFAIPAPSPAASPLPPVPTKFVLPSTIISDVDLQQLLGYCQRSLVPYKERPPERAFLNIVSIIAKFPWAERELWTEKTRDTIFDCAIDERATATRIALENALVEPTIFAPLAKKLRTIVLNCIGFTDKQKEAMRSVQDLPLNFVEGPASVWPQNALGVDFGPSLPPSPNQSRRASQVSVGHGGVKSHEHIADQQPLSSLPARPMSPPASPVFPPLPRGQNAPFRGNTATARSASGVWGRGTLVTTGDERDPSAEEQIAQMSLSD